MAHNQTTKLYRRELSAVLSSVFRDKPEGWGERLIRLFIIALPVVIYPAVLLSKEDGQRTYTPHGVWEHIALFTASAVILYVLLLGTVVLLISAEQGRKIPWVRFVIGMTGVQACRKLLREITNQRESADFEYKSMRIVLDGSQGSRVLRVYPVNRLQRLIEALPLDSVNGKTVTDAKYTTAWWRTQRTVHKAKASVARSRSFLESPQALSDALHVILNTIGECQTDGSESEFVYYSISGPLRTSAEMVFVKQHLVAGSDPFQPLDTYDPDRLAGEDWRFAALVCAPRWSHTHRFGRDDRGSAAVHERISDAAEASGTYRDTVASLWRRDWWDLYHQPDKVVRAAKVLDRRRSEHGDTYVA